MLVDSIFLDKWTLIVLGLLDVINSFMNPLVVYPLEALLCRGVDVTPLIFMKDCIFNSGGIVFPNLVVINLGQVLIIV